MQRDVKTVLEYSEFSINRLDYMLTTFVASTPAIFISSFYGMNLEGIPMLHWKYGFEVACVVMIALTILSVYWFRPHEMIPANFNW